MARAEEYMARARRAGRHMAGAASRAREREAQARRAREKTRALVFTAPFRKHPLGLAVAPAHAERCAIVRGHDLGEPPGLVVVN